MLFGEQLRAMRLERNLTQAALAAAMNTRQQNVARWESGELVPGFDDVLSLCTALGVKCTNFEGCQFAPAEESRGRGRPPKAEPAPKKPVVKSNKKKKP